MSQKSIDPEGSQPEPGGPPADLPALLEQFRSRLRMLVELRMDRRIRARLDPSDVVQEAFAEAVRRYPDYERDEREQGGKLSPYIWLRFLTLQQLALSHRRHLGVQARSANVEQSMNAGAESGLESGVMALCLAGAESTPSVKVSRAEEISRMTAALDELEPLDREVLALRHFEQLEHAGIGELLGLSAAAVSSRYRRALKKIGLAIKNQHGNS